MKTLKVKGICQRAEVFVDQQCNSVDVLLLVEERIPWLTVSSQKTRCWNCLSILFFTSTDHKSLDCDKQGLTENLHFMQQVSMYVVVQGCRLKHFDSESEAFLDKVSMTSRLPHLDCPKRFPMYQPGSMYEVADYGRGSASHKDLEQLPVDCKSNLFIFKIL